MKRFALNVVFVIGVKSATQLSKDQHRIPLPACLYFCTLYIW